MDSAHSTPPARSLTHHRIPQEIRRRRAWCPLKFELRDGKQTKIPYDLQTGHRAKSNNPKTWTSFEEASQAAGYDGIEYILSREDPYFLLDLDDVRNPSTGAITPEAREIIAPFKGKAFIETSTSGKGIHVFGQGKKPGTAWCRNPALGLELYDWGRPVVFTGGVIEGSTSELLDCQEELDRLYYEHMPEHLKNPPEREQGPPPEPVDLSDDALLQKAASSEYGEEFRALWAGDTSVTGGNHSRADYALMKHLMFWTGGDEARGIALFDKSGLARRKKWDRADYRQRTARKARMACTSFYQPKGEASEKLKAAVEDLWRRWWDFDWARLVGDGERPNAMRGHTCRDVVKVLIDDVASHGKVVEGGVEVSLGRRRLALKAATSLRTVHKSIKHLEAEGWLEFQPPVSEDKPGTYFIRASLHHVLSTHGGGERGESLERKTSVCSGGGEGLRAPRLRWSAPRRKPSKAEVRRARLGNHRLPEVRESIRRLGKIRGAVIDVLEDAGGTLTLAELAHALGKTRPRDLRRRTLAMLEEAGIIALDVETVTLADDWVDKLEEIRVRDGEVARERLDRERHAREGKAFRNRRKVKLSQHWTNNPEADGTVEDLRPADEPEPEKPQPYKEPPRPPEDDVVTQARKVDELVRQGMKRRLALEEVMGCVELGRRGPPRQQEPVEAPDDWRKHALACECSDCLYPEPRYAKPYQGAAV
jgi:hypothetical protein